ncbi:MAG TPA: hypothetical protein DEB05_09730, partial [Firmicutes bacterium]|nr:hypothetical protein [Bacillota bacterium]
CLVVGFTKEAGLLGPGATTEVYLGFNAGNRAKYHQQNDYSFLAHTHRFTENLNYPAYIGENLVWGVEPTATGQQEDPGIKPLRSMTAHQTSGEPNTGSSTPSLRLLYKAINRFTTTNCIQHHLRLIN